MTCQVPGCRNLSDLQYGVDPRNDKRICSPCFGTHTPLTLDTLLGVRQVDYGLENETAAAQQLGKAS